MLDGTRNHKETLKVDIESKLSGIFLNILIII